MAFKESKEKKHKRAAIALANKNDKPVSQNFKFIIPKVTPNPTTMISVITTVIVIILALVTAFLNVIMFLDRAKYVRALRGQTGISPNFIRSGPSELFTLIQIFLPVTLESASGEKTKALRDTAVASTRYAMISLLVTIIVPVILFRILESVRF